MNESTLLSLGIKIGCEALSLVEKKERYLILGIGATIIAGVCFYRYRQSVRLLPV